MSISKQVERAFGPYYADGKAVRKHPVERYTDRGQRITIGFPVLMISEWVEEGSAELIAKLMNAGHVALADQEAIEGRAAHYHGA
jgi:hypothetical protein